jgi:TfoX-like protein
MMAVVAYNEELAERVREALADRTDVEEKKMFGGLSFMVAGQMCCGVLKNDLIVRIEPTDFLPRPWLPNLTSGPSTSVGGRCRGWSTWMSVP